MKRALGFLSLAAALPVLVLACGRADLDLPPPYTATKGDATATDTGLDARVDAPDGAVPDTFVPDTFVPDTFVPDAGCLCGSGPNCTTCSAGFACVNGTCKQDCNASTCPSGCCDTTGTCVTGRTVDKCGSGGNACLICPSASVCGTDGKCYDVNDCNPATCAGCCIGNLCNTGNLDTACGKTGAECTNCSGTGKVCTSGACVAAPPKCDASNCGGCCRGTTCLAGDQAGACGASGAACEACGATESCVATGESGGTCLPNVALCGPDNCSGCCDGDVCVVGTDATKCGGGGAQCTACGAQRICTSNGPQQGGSCGPQSQRCNPSNCNGCCDGDRCVRGSTQQLCGQSGAACRNCPAEGAVCDVAANPRTCVESPNQCPSPYLTCSAASATPQFALNQGVCTSAQMATLTQPCAVGPNSRGCQAALAALPAACLACVQPFAVPFQQTTGLFACVAPFVDDACNQATGCASECTNVSCGACVGPQQGQCINQSASAQCSPFYDQAQCTLAAINGGGAFCNPRFYAGYGSWLTTVGTSFCGP